MGRPVQIRASYVADAQYLTRIARAVELDDKRPREWRKKVIDLLEELTGLFMSSKGRAANEIEPEKRVG